jgi:hypothetical protein
MTEKDCIEVLKKHGFKRTPQGVLFRFVQESGFLKIRLTHIAYGIELRMRVGGRGDQEPLRVTETIRLCEFEDGKDLIDWISGKYAHAYNQVIRNEIDNK